MRASRSALALFLLVAALRLPEAEVHGERDEQARRASVGQREGLKSNAAILI